MKINRLLQIIIILLNRNNITAKELAERFHVSMRTIYRDIEELSIAGIPVYMSKGKGGGIFLFSEYTLSKNILTKEERENVIVALNTLKSTNKLEIETTIEKLQSIFGNINGLDWIEVDLNNWGDFKKEDKRFEVIKNAIIEQKIIRFKYINGNNIKSERSVEPYKILFKGQAWYLKAFCLGKQDFRIFKINRCRDISITEKSFELREVNDEIVKDAQEHTFNTIKLKLKFNKDMLYHVYDYYNEDEVYEDDFGNYIVVVEYPYDEWIYSHILSYGTNVEILEPKFVREEVKNRINAMMKKYN